MNAKRRKEIGKIIYKINERIMATVDEIQSEIDAVRSEEQEVIDNMPENLQGSERYEVAESEVDALDEAYDDFEEAISSLRDVISSDSFRMLDKSHIKITGIKEPVRIKEHDVITKVRNPYVIFDGRFWYFSYSREVQEFMPSNSTEVIGVDLGIKDLAVTSKNVHYENVNKTNRVKQLNKRKKRLQRKVSKKYQLNKQGSKFVKTENIKKLEQQLRLLNRKIANIRETYNHTVTKDLVRTTPKAVVIEDLQVKNMLRNKHLSDAIANQGWYQIRQMLDYKCKLQTVTLIVADKFFASSKTCSNCGYKKPQLSLSERTFVCPDCGAILDRDYNAALNLKHYGENLLGCNVAPVANCNMYLSVTGN